MSTDLKTIVSWIGKYTRQLVAGKADADNVYTKGEVYTKDEVYTKTEENSLLDEKVDKSELGLEGGVIKKTIVVSGTDNSLAQSSANEFTAVRGGTDYSNGASLVVYGKNEGSTWAGCARLIAQDGTNTNILNLFPNGNLKLGDDDVERVVARGTNYIRYANGLQIVWGSVSSRTNQTSTQFTFAQTFKDANYAAAETAQTSVAARMHNMGSFANNGATIYHESLSSSLVFRYIAIGLWK